MKTENKKYKFEEYKPIYNEIFEKEKNKLIKILPDVNDSEIEHVGSTAVPGLGGKGIIDIAIRTPKKKLKIYLKKLKEQGFEYKPHPGDDERKFLQKINNKYRRTHIHLTLNENYWKSFIAFRDYLKENEKSRKEYENIKKEAVEKGKENEDYRKHKERFLKKVTKDDSNN